MTMVLGRSGRALQGPVVEREQGTPGLLKVTEFEVLDRLQLHRDPVQSLKS
jgi:hypothetical protein